MFMNSNNENYEDVEFDIDQDVYDALQKLAEEKNISFNDLIINILESYIAEQQDDSNN